MLVYLSAGARDYEARPIVPLSRISWEIQAVVEGRIAFHTPLRLGTPRHRTLWVTPPGHVHGWRGDQGSLAQVIVFHFESLPDPVAEWVRRLGHLEQALTSAQIQHLRTLYAEAQDEWRRPGLLSGIRWSRMALDLTLLIGELINPGLDGAGEALGRPITHGARVELAMRLFSEHLHEGWGVEEVGRAAGISAPHLRRLFHEVLGASPRKTFERIRLRRAQELMLQPGPTLESVAQACGYQNGATLSRAFRRELGITPSQWQGRAGYSAS